jgi:hypothetical protein
MKPNPLSLYSLVYGADPRSHLYLNVSILQMTSLCTSHAHRELRKRGIRHNIARQAMLVAVLTMYSLSTICYALDVTILWRELNIVLPQRLSPSAMENDVNFELNLVDGPLIMVQSVCFCVNVCNYSFSRIYPHKVIR